MRRGLLRTWPALALGAGAVLLVGVLLAVLLTRGGEKRVTPTTTAPTTPLPTTTAPPPTQPPTTTTPPPPTQPPLQPQPLPPVKSATTADGGLVVNGSRVFPLMVFEQCPEAYAESLGNGINLFLGNCDRGVEAQLEALGGRALAAASYDQPGVERPELVGWYLPDEADIHGFTGENLPARPLGVPAGRVSFLTLTAHFYSGAAEGPAGRSIYPALVAAADVVGFDLYPMQVWCRRNRIVDVFHAQRELVQLARGKPTFQWIETHTMQCRDNPKLAPSPATVRAEAWLAVAGGATGLGFFPSYYTPEVAQEIRGIALVAADLRELLTAPPGRASATGVVRAGVRRAGGRLLVIAANPTDRAVTATITVPGLDGRPLDVYGQGRRVPSRRDSFTDAFPPLGVWLYLVG